MSSALRVETPQSFGLREVLIENVIGAVYSLIFSVSGVLALLFYLVTLLTREYLLFAIGLLPSLIFGVAFFFLPAGLGNFYVRRIVRGFLDEEQRANSSYICQVAFSPRLHSGFRGYMEDADDIGHLRITDEAIEFTGDHVQILLPLNSIKRISHSNVGWRGLWIMGRRIRVASDHLHDLEHIEFMERQADTLTSSLRVSGEIIRELEGSAQLSDAIDG